MFDLSSMSTLSLKSIILIQLVILLFFVAQKVFEFKFKKYQSSVEKKEEEEAQYKADFKSLQDKVTHLDKSVSEIGAKLDILMTLLIEPKKLDRVL